jgi:hypothetical protein
MGFNQNIIPPVFSMPGISPLGDYLGDVSNEDKEEEIKSTDNVPAD